MILPTLRFLALPVLWLAIGLADGLEPAQTNALFFVAVAFGIVSFLPREGLVSTLRTTLVFLLFFASYAVAADASWSLPEIADTRIALAPAPLLLAAGSAGYGLRRRDPHPLRRATTATAVALGAALAIAAALLALVALREHALALGPMLGDIARRTVELALLTFVTGSLTT